MLLDNGYLVRKVNHTEPTNNNRTTKFMEKAKSYVKKTRSNLQRDLGQGRIANEFLYESELIKTLAAMNCENARQLRRLQRLILTALPDIANSYLFPKNRGLSAQSVGDALLVGECMRIRSFNVSWDHKYQNVCYHLFPLHKALDNRTYFLELHTRRVFKHSHKINCRERDVHFVVKDVKGIFWQYTLHEGFQTVRVQHMHHRKTHLHLAKLKGFNKRLLHYQTSQPHRTTLLHLLNQQKENLETISDYTVIGHGNLALGVVHTLADTITFIGKTGEELFKTVGNVTEDLIGTTANGLVKIVGSVGISNLVLYVLDILIISYLVILRYRPPCCRVLQPTTGPDAEQREIVHTIPPIIHERQQEIE